MADEANRPRNILCVENGIGYGGAIICLRHLVRNLDRRHYRPMVVTGRTGPQYREIADDALWKHIPDRHFDVVGIRERLDARAWPGRVPALRPLLGQLLARADDLFNFLPFFLQLLWSAWRFRADLIHANNEPLCNRAALLVGKALRIPTVNHVRGNLNGGGMLAWTFTLPDHFIPVSNWVAEGMRDKFSVPPEKISVIYDGIALDRLDTEADGTRFRERFGVDGKAFAVGLVGLLIPWKGQEIFLDAARALRNEIPGLKMLIVGGTPDDCIPYEQRLRRRVAEQGLEDTVIFTGHVTGMEAVYNGLDVVVSASTSPEPLGTVVIEAMAMGRPLIGPDHGGAAEMMTHMETGLLFAHGDANDLARAIKQFHDSPSLRRSLGSAARRKALKTFSVVDHARRVEQVYERILNK